jgi:molybdopterin/thiamine biosynthesis adenylyltransferase
MAHVAVVGAGGNIGSHLVPHLARLPLVTKLTLIDRDRYAIENLSTQAIDARQIGRAKVRVVAADARRINAGLEIDVRHSSIEDVPLGALRVDVLLACLDSRRARQVVNQAASRLGVPWIDAGVLADGWLARVQRFVPSEAGPCLECAWREADYALVEQEYRCQRATDAAPTRAPASLGALAASLQALACQQWLSEGAETATSGIEVLVDARHQRHFVTAYSRNAACRMPDHRAWHLETGRVAVSAVGRTLFVQGASLPGAPARLDLGVAGQTIALAVTCTACRRSSPTFLLERALRARPRKCRGCGGSMAPAAFEVDEAVPVRAIPPRVWSRRLAELGLAAGDVVTFATGEASRHVQLEGA